GKPAEAVNALAAEGGLPDGIPAEFAEYFAGALAWHEGKRGEAVERWSAVLKLPPTERRYRSTWAAFMIGRVQVKEADSYVEVARAVEEAARSFERVRDLEAAGFPDPLGLAAASYGWEARARLAAGDYSAALHLYLLHYASGDDTAINSLRIAAARASAVGGPALAAIAQHPQARQVLTAYFVSHPVFGEQAALRDAPVRHWAVALREAGVSEVAEADRLAWLAYEAGLFSLAWEWIALARVESPEAQWLRAKLALRGGDLAGGEKFLRAALASPGLAEVHRDRIAGELGRVCLARDDFRGALIAATIGGHWKDAAFVAERVMKVEELTAFVREWPVPAAGDAQRVQAWGAPADLRGELRHLLARRLARMGRVEVAVEFFPPELQPVFRRYAEDVALGFDGTKTATERAAGFWRAAQGAREQGMALLGTELEPDWAIWSGSFELQPAVRGRLGKPEAQAGMFAPTPSEAKRLAGQRAPEKRFHYRYRAAELAWWAASLLPNDSEETAGILATAGGWLKGRDPQAAEQFYRALVIRCGNTPLGRAAAAKRWFPDGETTIRE
ncbi:MAG: hypothetical protein ABIZ49_10270, partial [Opitutaceae bacterium]